MKKRGALVQFLRQSAGHKAIAQIDDQLSEGHFYVAGRGRNDAKSGELACRGQVCQRQEGQPEKLSDLHFCHNSKSKRDGHVSEGDGNAVSHSLPKGCFMIHNNPPKSGIFLKFFLF